MSIPTCFAVGNFAILRRKWAKAGYARRLRFHGRGPRLGNPPGGEALLLLQGVNYCYICHLFSQIPFFFLSLDEILGIAYHYDNIDSFYFSLLFYSKVNIKEPAVPLVQEAHPHLHRSQPRRGARP